MTLLGLLASAGCGGSSPTAPALPVGLGIACPPNIQTSSLGGQPVPLTYAAPISSGGTVPVTVTCEPAAGTLFPVGSSAVTCTAADANGQRAMCGFTVMVTAIPKLLQTRFMTFGDSLTEGKLSLTAMFLVDSPAHSYPAKLLRLLEERYSLQQVTVINEGYGGERVEESYSRFKAALSTHRPEAVLLMHGVNDLNGDAQPGQPGRVQTTANAIEELTKEARRAGLTTFLATLPPLGPGPKASCPECVEPYNERIRSIAAAKGAVLVDVHAAWAGRTGLMGADGIHPTEAGYDVIARTFFDSIQRTLEAAVLTQ